jgi:hypothetical protein
MASELIAYCGLYCGACSFRLAALENNREHIINMPSQYDPIKNNPIEYCPGCRLENKCDECEIRDCAVNKGINYCCECAEFPCEILNKFDNDGKPHHREVLRNLSLLKKNGEIEWLEYMDKKWTCKCGKKISWYYKSCNCTER